MEKYTVAFFGHRTISRCVLPGLYDCIEKMLEEHEYVEFLVGREGQFDSAAASAVREHMKTAENCSLTLVLPYMTAEYKKHPDFLRTYYSDIEVCEASSKAHYKAAYSIRNREMADRADMVICFIDHESGGAWKAVQYAQKKGKCIRNVFLTE